MSAPTEDLSDLSGLPSDVFRLMRSNPTTKRAVQAKFEETLQQFERENPGWDRSSLAIPLQHVTHRELTRAQSKQPQYLQNHQLSERQDQPVQYTSPRPAQSLPQQTMDFNIRQSGPASLPHSPYPRQAMRGSQDVNHGSPHLAGPAPPQHGYPSRHSSSPAHRPFGQTPQECFSPSPRQLTNPTYAEEAYSRPPSRNASQPPAQEPTHDGLSLQHERAQQEWAAATQGWRDAVVALADQQIRLNAADAHLKALGIKPDRDRVLDSQRP